MKTQKYLCLYDLICILFCVVIMSVNTRSLAQGIASKDDFLVAWLKRNAIPLKNIDPNDEDFSDLEPLGEVIGDARIVQLGEETHGDGATFYAKTRLIKFLHQKLGFDVLAFESGLYDCHKAWQLLCEGMDPYDAFKHGVFGIWSSSGQVRPLIEYWGQAAKSDRPLELCGFDRQFTSRASRELLIEDVNSLLIKLGTDAIGDKLRFDILKTITALKQRPRDPNQEERELLQSTLSLWGKALDNAKPSAVLPETELAFWRQFVVSITTYAAQGSEPPDGVNRRDQQMARNLVWLARTAYPNRKIIVWAASWHIGRHQDKKGRYLMGHELDKLLGQEVYTIAFTAAEGWWKVPYLSTGVRLEPPAIGSLEDLFVQAGFENAFVDFRKLDADGAWRKEKLVARPFGYDNQEANWTEIFDAFIFTKHMTGNTRPGQRVPINPPIFAAAELNDVDWVRKLLEKGADANSRTRTGDTPLIYATVGGDNKTVVELLIAKGADINAKDNSGWTPLLSAAVHGRKEVVELLLTKGADIDARGRSDRTALHIAATMDQKDVAALLIAKGAGLNSKDVNGQTPLHLAVRQGHRDTAELLINEGADVNAKNKAGLTPLDLAEQKGLSQIVELLRKHGAKE